jgi:TatD DNase family protein
MTHRHKDRSWAPAPPKLGVQAVDNHTHVLSVIPAAQQMAKEAEEKGQPEVPIPTLDEVLDQAAAVGVAQVIDVGCEYPFMQSSVEFAKLHPGKVYAGIAIHPNDAPLHGHHGAMGPDGLPLNYMPWHDVPLDEAIAEVSRLAKANPDVVKVIGETGMDLFRTGDAAEPYQLESFRDHIAIAKELGLPIQIHDRNAHQQVIDTLLADGAPEAGTVFHSFSGDAPMAQIAKEHGWYLSFSGTLTFKGNDDIREALALMPRDHILVETDAPYLAPMPYRGRTNAPYMIPYTLSVMADVLDISIDEAAGLTADNARRLYRFS